MTAAPSSPYKGLSPFDDTELDALFFFGREREREIIVANVIAARVTVLYGATGVGKSSILRAGVARELRALPERPLVLTFSRWSEDPRSLFEDAVAAADAADRDVYVLLDQLEEYFLYRASRNGLGDELARLLDPALRVNVLLSLREDELAKLDRFKESVPGLFANVLQLDRLDRAAARAAIVKPVERWNELAGESITVEPELVEAVLDGVGSGRMEQAFGARTADLGDDGRGIEAAFLQLVMQRLWEVERDAGSDVLRGATFLRLGGAQRIVADHLETAIAGFDSVEEDVASRLFHHLVTPSGTKIAHDIEDLAGYAEVGESALRPVLRRLATHRILRPIEGERGAERYEIFHDVLADPVLAWHAQHEASRALRRERAEAARRHRRLLVVAATSLVALAVMSVISVYALSQRTEAREQAALARSSAADAREQESLARTRARQARARELTARALLRIETDPLQSLTHGIRAVRAERSPDTEDVLRRALIASRLRLVLPSQRAPAATFNPSGTRVVTATRGGARIVDVRSGRRIRALRHPGSVRAMSYSGAGHFIVTGGDDRAVRVWESRTGRLLRTLRQSAPVTDAAIDTRGDVVVGAGRHVLHVWSAGDLLHVVPHPAAVRDVELTADGAYIATVAADDFVRVFSARGGSQLYEIEHDAPVTAVTFAHDGTSFATTSGDRVTRVFQTFSGTRLRELAAPRGPILRAAFSRRAKLLVTAGPGRTARVWNVAKATPVATLVHPNTVTNAKISQDGTYVVTSSRDRTARVWETAGGRPRWSLVGHSDTVVDATFDRAGTHVVTTAADGTARVWDAGTASELRLLGHHSGPVLDVSISADGRRVVTAGAEGAARIWRFARPFRVRTLRHRGRVASAAFSADGERVVTASGTRAYVWDATSGRLLYTLTHRRAVVSAHFGGGDAFVFTAGRDGIAAVWRRGERLTTLRHPSAVTAASASDDGERIATADANGVVQVWDQKTGDLVRRLTRHRGAVTTATFSRDGRFLLTAGEDRTARVWDAERGELMHTFVGHREAITRASFSRDGKLVVTASRDGDARLWSVDTGGLLPGGTLRGHAGALEGAGFSPDARWVVTAGPSSAGLWDVSRRRLLLFLRGHESPLTKAVFGPDGRRVVTASSDGTVRAYLCDVCGTARDLLELADTRLEVLRRPLGADERRRFLSTPS